MSVDFRPNLGEYKSMKPFFIWCQKVLPLVYDDSLSYYEVLTKVVAHLNTVIENVNTAEENISLLSDAYDELQGYVNHYFDNLDVQEEINNKLDVMAEDGTLSSLIEPYMSSFTEAVDNLNTHFTGEVNELTQEVINLQALVGTPLIATSASAMTNQSKIYVYVGDESGYVNGNWYYWDGNSWESGGVYNSEALETDKTLSVEGMAGDAKITGNFRSYFYKSSGNEFINEWVDGKCITTTGDTVDLTGETAVSNTVWTYQIIDCVEGDEFTLTGRASNASYRLWVWCASDGTVISKPAMNLTYADQVITCPSGATKLLVNVRNDSAYSICTKKYVDVRLQELYAKYDNIIDPDDYTGTDSQKLASAIADVDPDGQAVILIKRKYTLTANVYITHSGYATSHLIFLGVGKGSGFECAQYGFKPYDSSQSYGMVKFENILFNWTNILFDVGYLIRMFFESCVFDAENNSGTQAFRNDRFMQTYYFHLCVFRHMACVFWGTTDNKAHIDISCSQCLFEHLAIILRGYDFHGITFYQCCIEGLYRTAIQALGDIRGLYFNGCYFEGNNNGAYIPEFISDYEDGNGLTIDLSGTDGGIQEIVIENNRFLYRTGNEIIKLRTSLYTVGKLIVCNNWLNPALPDGARLIKTSDANTNIRNDIIYSGNSSTRRDMIGGSQRIFDRTTASIAYITELTDSDDCNAIANPGFYHGSDSNTISHAPSTNAFYLMDVESNAGHAQIAITVDGVKSRIGNGEWV